MQEGAEAGREAGLALPTTLQSAGLACSPAAWPRTRTGPVQPAACMHSTCRRSARCSSSQQA